MKQFIADYFNFTKKERNGTLMLLLLICLLLVVPFVFPFFIHKKTVDSSQFETEIASLTIKRAEKESKYPWKNDDDNPIYGRSSNKSRSTKEQWNGELFYFDPNTLDEASWKKLGIGERAIAIIQNYISKGGKFYTSDDIRKIWGLSEEEKERLEPFIRIEKGVEKNSSQSLTHGKGYTEKPKHTAPSIDINTADTSAFISLPGIGSKLSQRIVSFREKLGGFYKPDQVAETFGLNDSTFQKIRSRLIVSSPVVKQLNINTAALDELRSHPYIRYSIANAIVQYRTQHGNFSNLNELKKIELVTDEVYNKALPYLKTE